jgi:hypothetical protein
MAEKNCSHYFELYKKYRLRWLEENQQTDILEKYAPPAHTSVIISCRTLAPVVQKGHRIMAGLSQARVFVYSM